MKMHAKNAKLLHSQVNFFTNKTIFFEERVTLFYMHKDVK